MKHHARTIVLALAGVALAASVASLYVHYRMIADPTYTSFCDISETVSCEAVYASAYGTVRGVPVAAGGAIWSALVLLLAYAGLRAPSGGAPIAPPPHGAGVRRGDPGPARRGASDVAAAAAGYIFVLATIGLAAVLYFGYASFFVLNRMCVLCVAVYVSVVGIFLLSGASAQVALGALPGRVSRDLSAVLRSSTALTLAVAWLAGSIALVAFFPREELQPVVSAAPVTPPTEVLQPEEVAQFEAWLSAQPRVDLPIDAEGARVVVVKFNDYQCPACRQTHLEYRWIVEKYRQSAPNDVRFVHVDFPLESECNTGGPHGAACEAAAAVRLAREKGRAEAMEEWLFQNQSASMTRDQVKAGLEEVAQVTDFDERYPKVLELVRADALLGQRLGIGGTPTFYINGIKINTSLRPIYFDAAIQYELKRTEALGSEGSGPS
ncbi:MAG: thioredoxin domain-containing protein [Acidobacteria bacterium]|nr:thioredoxin domain-containing protein [Acidobacteriota bacterium]